MGTSKAMTAQIILSIYKLMALCLHQAHRPRLTQLTRSSVHPLQHTKGHASFWRDAPPREVIPKHGGLLSKKMSAENRIGRVTSCCGTSCCVSTLHCATWRGNKRKERCPVRTTHGSGGLACARFTLAALASIDAIQIRGAGVKNKDYVFACWPHECFSSALLRSQVPQKTLLGDDTLRRFYWLLLHSFPLLLFIQDCNRVCKRA